MSAEKFLLALRRFFARRGKPDEIILDNASQFKVAKNAVNSVWKNVINNEDVFTYVSDNNIKWRFITEFAPWEGGFYERLVAMVKSCLRKSIGRILLTKDQLNTFIIETESVINSRPLVYVNDDLNTNYITPGHFLNWGMKTGTPNFETKENLDGQKSVKTLLELWKKGQHHLDTAWNLWRNDYLLSLRERYQKQWKASRVPSQIFPVKNQVVHVKDKLPRGAWKMGKISELILSRDGKIRSARILLSSGNIINRPLNLLYPLETAVPEEYLSDNSEPKTVIPSRHDAKTDSSAEDNISQPQVSNVY